VCNESKIYESLIFIITLWKIMNFYHNMLIFWEGPVLYLSHLPWTLFLFSLSIFCSLLCSDILQRVRESGFLTELCKHMLILPQTFQYFLSSAQTHLTLLLQWPPAVWQDTQFCQSFTCFQNVRDILLISSHFQTSTAHNKTLKHACSTHIHTEHI